MRLMLLLGAAVAPLAFAGVAAASDEPVAPIDNDPVTALEEVIVTGQPQMRNRTDDVVPTLSYDLEYFQRFEPLTAGDALKRVPSVTFLSDVLESDGVRLRGLDPAYTQILINGERIPGAGGDRSFFVDRIPAELIERVEVVRSSSANRSGDAVAGAINIVLRDALSLDGGYVRAGGILLSDDELKGTFGGVWGGEVGPGRLLFGASVQGRRNPKSKFSQRFGAPDEDIDNIEVQSDIRDGTDYSANASYEVDLAGGTLELNGLFVRTDRLQNENSMEYNGGEADPAELAKINANPLDILTDNYSVGGRFTREMLGGEFKVRLGYSAIDDDQQEREDELDVEDEVLEGAMTDSTLKDEEWSAAIGHELRLSGGTKLEIGVQYVGKTRDTTILEAEGEVEDVTAFRTLAASEFEDFEIVDGGLNTIEETRVDPYVMLSGETGRVKWQAGLRYETTDVEITDETVDDDLRVTGSDYGILLPSASVRFALSDTDRVTASVARTVRRPNFDNLTPVTLEEEHGDNDFRGNPFLKPETAWGVDLGFERRLGRRGVVGINAFYRDVTDLIEDVNTGEQGSGGAGTFIETIDNVGDGQVYGVEFDLSTPLDFIGMEQTGVFLNASWLDSKVDDALGERRFNDQSDYVLNVGFTHDIKTWGAAFGATYRKQGDAFGRVYAEEVRTSYGADLEVFVEKQLFANTVIRLTGSNLLDSSKDEIFDKFDDQADQIDREYDEYEIETESAGPVYQLVMRVAF